MLAQALAARMVAICLKEPIPPTVSNLADSRRTSFWLITALVLGRQADPFQTATEAQPLAVALNARASRNCALPYSLATKVLRPRIIQAVLEKD